MPKISLLAIIILAGMLAGAFLPSPAQAQSIAISGSFYRQHFQLYPGESTSDSSAYVTVFNPGEEEIPVKLATETPPDVALTLSDAEFSLPPGGRKKVLALISVAPEATPGEYRLAVIAHVKSGGGSGITIVPAAKQEARLTILGEAEKTVIRTVLPDGSPFPAQIDLYRSGDDVKSAIGGSANGELETSLPPDSYIAEASYNGITLGRKGFRVDGTGTSDISLEVHTVSIPELSVTPAYEEDKIGAADMLYLLSNAYQPLEDVTLQLEVELDDQPFEEKVLSVFPSLNVGTMPGSYHYKPEQGWENGNYSFSLQLISDDEVLARSTGAEFDLEGVAGAPLLSSLLAWLEEHWKIIAVIAALLALAGAGWVLLNRLRNSVKVTLENSELVATFNESTGEIVKTTVNYSLLNERRTTPQVRVELQVSKDEDSDSITIASMDSLEKGRSSGSYEYFPQEGWQDGVRYRFRLALYLAGKLDTLTKLRMTKAAEPG